LKGLEMITAEEARARSKKGKEYSFLYCTEYVRQRIMEATDRGEHKIKVNRALLPNTVANVLRENGFVVTTTDSVGEVNWYKEDE